MSVVFKIDRLQSQRVFFTIKSEEEVVALKLRLIDQLGGNYGMVSENLTKILSIDHRSLFGTDWTWPLDRARFET